jgi:multiple sugar transport system ATP-binding protein
MRAEISRLQHDLGTTTIYVTHDQVEAMTMGHRVAVMRKGELQQVAPPQELYDRPGNLFVASFIGSPPMNLVEATVTKRNGGLGCRIGDQELALPDSVAKGKSRLRDLVGRTIALGVRPERLQDAGVAPEAPAEQRLRGRVLLMEALGAELIAHVEISGKPVLHEEVLEGTVEMEEAVVETRESEARERRTTLLGRFDVASRAKPDEEIEVVVDTERLHFFDLESGEAIDASRGA